MMKLSVIVDPPLPRVGEKVTFGVDASDEDAPVRECYAVSYGTGIGGPVCGTSLNECPLYYGTLKPPAPEPDSKQFVFAHAYREPGEYTATFRINSGNGYMPICGPPNPYSDIIVATVNLVVVP